jgi:hypothetical protein
MELVVAGGFEPPKRIASDLKSLPFDQTREYYQVAFIEGYSLSAVGFEPTTTRLKATRSKPTELNRLDD